MVPSAKSKVGLGVWYSNPVLALGAVLRALSRDTGTPLADNFDERIERYAAWCDKRIDEGFDAGYTVYTTINNLCRASGTGLLVVYRDGELGIV